MEFRAGDIVELVDELDLVVQVGDELEEVLYNYGNEFLIVGVSTHREGYPIRITHQDDTTFEIVVDDTEIQLIQSVVPDVDLEWRG